MQTRIAALGCAVLLGFGGCTQPVEPPTAPVPTPAGASVPGATASTSGGSGEPTGTKGSARPEQLPTITLGGDEIAGRPLGTTPFARVEPLIEARLGEPKAGRPRLCRLAGERSPLGMVDYSWPGLTLLTGRRGAETVVIAWSVDLAKVPEGFRLADRLPWQPTFAVLGTTDGVVVAIEGGMQIARLGHTSITYSGPEGAAGPDAVAGGPGFTCS